MLIVNHHQYSAIGINNVQYERDREIERRRWEKIREETESRSDMKQRKKEMKQIQRE